MKTFFLHIGTPKTATTAIQKFCADNRQLLAKKGFCFPESVYAYKLISPYRNAHFLVGKVMREDETGDREEARRVYKLGMERLNQCFLEYDNVIMSDENIWWASSTHCKGVWKRLKADMQKNGYVVKPILYLRRQDEFLSSRWNQMVKKTTLTEPWDEHFRNAPDKMAHVLDYETGINRMARIFGKENIIVRRFDRRAFYQGTVFADFLHSIGLELTDEFIIPQEELNLAIKGNAIEVMRIMNTAPNVNRFNKMYLRSKVSMCSEESEKKYKYAMLSKEEATEFLERYREGNERIAAEFIGDGRPLFDYEVMNNLPIWDKNNEYMIEDIIRIFTVITQDLHEEVERLKKENAGCRKEFAIIRDCMKKEASHIKLFIWKMKHPIRVMWSKLMGRKLMPSA